MEVSRLSNVKITHLTSSGGAVEGFKIEAGASICAKSQRWGKKRTDAVWFGFLCTASALPVGAQELQYKCECVVP